MATTASGQAKEPDVKNVQSENPFWLSVRMRARAAAEQRLAREADAYLKREIRAAEARIAQRRQRKP